jgi:hypothetical protein
MSMIGHGGSALTYARSRVAAFIGWHQPEPADDTQPEPHEPEAPEPPARPWQESVQALRDSIPNPYSTDDQCRAQAVDYDGYLLRKLADATNRLGDPWAAALETFGGQP